MTAHLLVKLTKSLRPKPTDDMIRLGRENDGGYLVSKSDVMNSDILISMGMYDDWSFEKNFHHLNPIPVYVFDGSVNLRFFVRSLVKSLLKIWDPITAVSRLRILIDYI